MRKIGIAIPTFCRFQMTIDSFRQVLDDERVESVTIVDDASIDDSCERLVEYFNGNDKVRIYRNDKNYDCHKNKMLAIHKSTSEWNILLDSDNTIDESYLDALYSIPDWDKQTIYQPSYAKPHFDFRQWSGLTITRQNVAQYANAHLMTSLNACNHFVNREEYLKVFDGSVNPGSSDSIYFMFKWLEAGNKVYITPNLEYTHFISEKGDGHYQQNSSKFVMFHEELMNKIRALQ